MANNNINSKNTDIELDRFKQILNTKINSKKNQIFLSHSRTYNNSLQCEIDCLRRALG